MSDRDGENKSAECTYSVICGESWKLEHYHLPRIDYCLTRPPDFQMLDTIDVTQQTRSDEGVATKYGEDPVIAKALDDYVSNLVNLCTALPASQNLVAISQLFYSTSEIRNGGLL